MELAVHTAAFTARDSAIQRAAGGDAGGGISVYERADGEGFNADFLITYLVHPGTAIYVGYNSDLQNLNVQPNVGVVNTAKGFLNDSRQFFVKVSYMFRF